jgi:hypothetical protein
MQPEKSYLDQHIGTYFDSEKDFQNKVVEFLNSDQELSQPTVFQIENLRRICDSVYEKVQSQEIVLPDDKSDFKQLFQHRVSHFIKLLNTPDDSLYIYSDIRRISPAVKDTLKIELGFIAECLSLNIESKEEIVSAGSRPNPQSFNAVGSVDKSRI